MPLLDECMATVVGGELDPAAAGYVYCGMIGICSKLGDYGRASEWTEATLRWCERRSVPAFPGVCRIHRAELKLLHGHLHEAEADALAACEELPRYNFVSGQGPAHYEIGEVRRQLGDFVAAEEAYARAEAFGRPPQPGRSLLRLAEGKVDAAASGIRQALDEQGADCLLTGPAAGRAGHDRPRERRRRDGRRPPRTSSTRSSTGSVRPHSVRWPLPRGVRCSCQGATRRAPSRSCGELGPGGRSSKRRSRPPMSACSWRRRARPIGDEDAARAEARSARETFERLGARPGAARARRLLDRLALESERPERVTRAFMFTDIVRSTDLIGVIGDDAWEDLLTWHDRTLRSLFAAHGGDVGHPTGDGFFVAFPDARSALGCAVAVQRALAEHRRSEGFSLSVRIGIHAGAATRRGEDYGGAEVHRAARIAALADGGEILASRSTMDEAGSEVPFTATGDVTLKGFTEPVALVSVTWR